MKPLNIIFAGTPDFAAQHLAALLNSHHNIIAVYTQPDKPAGRGKKLQASPVKQLAEQHQIPVYQPKSLRKEDAQAELKALNADVMVVVAYGLILPQAVLDMPRLGCFKCAWFSLCHVGVVLHLFSGLFGQGINKPV